MISSTGEVAIVDGQPVHTRKKRPVRPREPNRLRNALPSSAQLALCATFTLASATENGELFVWGTP